MARRETAVRRLRKLKGTLLCCINSMEAIARANKRDLNNQDDIEWCADIYLMMLGEGMKVAPLRGLKFIPTHKIPMMMVIIEQQQKLNVMIEEERIKIRQLMVDSINFN